MYKVFFEDRLFLLSEFPVKKFDKYSCSSYSYAGKEDLQTKIHMLRENISPNILNVYYGHLDKLYEDFKELFIFIEAAGGIVQNNNGEVLFIYRRGKWDLPKGKKEDEETLETTAIREVEEECGIKNIGISGFLTHSYHTYKLGRTEILKKTWWYNMVYKGQAQLIPQTEEEITDIMWINPANVESILNNTYASIRQVFLMFNSGS